PISFSSILNGVIYAADGGADVVNMSLGGAFTKAGDGRLVGLLNKVFNYARSKGVTVVVSAGNSAADLDHDGNTYWTFCNTPSVICVAATGPTSDANATSPNPNLVRNGPWTNIDAPAYYTNFGRSVINVAAPGGNSSFGPPLAAPAGRDVFVWAACCQTSLIVGCFSSPFFILGAQGTSMAAPQDGHRRAARVDPRPQSESDQGAHSAVRRQRRGQRHDPVLRQGPSQCGARRWRHPVTD